MDQYPQRREIHDYDLDDTTVRDLSILLGVVAAAFIGIGVAVYFFGEDQTSISAANNAPAAHVTKAPHAAPPATTGQGGAQ